MSVKFQQGFAPFAEPKDGDVLSVHLSNTLVIKCHYSYAMTFDMDMRYPQRMIVNDFNDAPDLS